MRSLPVLEKGMFHVGCEGAGHFLKMVMAVFVQALQSKMAGEGGGGKRQVVHVFVFGNAQGSIQQVTNVRLFVGGGLRHDFGQGQAGPAMVGSLAVLFGQFVSLISKMFGVFPVAG